MTISSKRNSPFSVEKPTKITKLDLIGFLKMLAKPDD
jgi:hypothetical protein